MMSRAENEALTSIGRGTVMGELMRQYWIPALRSDELPHPDCDPVRLMLLGERLVAFRDTAGQVAVLADACPHRGASLFLGRNEEGGLRCAYHGWKFDARGQCVDMPCEPPGGLARRKLRARAYPCRERAGLVWTYMGPREVPPPLPEFEMNLSPGASRIDFTLVRCNWLQNLDGDVDTDHIPVLHGGNFESFRATMRGEGSRGGDVAPQVQLRARAIERLPTEVVDSPVGCTYASEMTAASRRQAVPNGPGFPQLWSVGQFMLPFYAMLPYGSLGAHWVVARVPMDDEHTMTIGMYAPGSAIPDAELMFGPQPAHLPNGAGWFERFRLARNPDNSFGLDRELARSVHGPFAVGAGIRGQAVQDMWITQSMGSVSDRTQEHLGAGDAVIIQVRKRLLNAARALADEGITPPGVDAPGAYRMKQGVMRLRNGRSWQDELAASSVSGRAEAVLSESR